EKGSEWCIKQWGPVPERLFGGTNLTSACFLWHPSKTGKQPLVFHDFCDLFAGYLELPYVIESIWSSNQCREISDSLGAELDTWLAQRGGIRAGMAQLKQLYPHNEAQFQKLQQVILGQSTYSPVELTQERCQLVLHGIKDPGRFCATQFCRELICERNGVLRRAYFEWFCALSGLPD
ncbi:MAG: hypothetical protein EBZ24_11715, partial [Synechococcaceae bacterium WB9_4xB_025]|nr:hypothetical protein [Synechococcaceae bacterium WB9_4xB_025]